MIWLRYIDSDVSAGAPQSRRINDLVNYDRPDVELVSGRTLRSTGYQHRISHRLTYEVSIGADVLSVSGAKAFVIAFWVAQQRFISLSTSETVPADETFIAIDLDGDGEMPLEFVEGATFLPTTTLKLIEKYRRG